MATRLLVMAAFAAVVLLAVSTAPVTAALSGEAPTIEWQRLLGGGGGEYGESIQRTADGGYIFLGSSSSSLNGDVTGTNHGLYDFWVVKLDSSGTVQWQKLLGGSGADTGHSVQQTSDGGYILVGDSFSTQSGDVTGTNHGSGGTIHGTYTSDLWVVKLDSAGTLEWQRLLGGSGDDNGQSIRQTSDGGYVLLGSSDSSQNGDITGINHGGSDFWVVKLDGAGTTIWQKLLGGSEPDEGWSVHQTADDGYVLVGNSYSSVDGDVIGTNHGSPDIWVVKLNSAGTIQWQKLLGGSAWDNVYSVQPTSDGGYVLVGGTKSSQSGDVTGANHGSPDVWVVKLNSAGAIQWQRLLGGSDNDYGLSIQPTSDSGYVLFGGSYSSQSGDIAGINHGSGDTWVVKLDGTGATQWQRLLGGSGGDRGTSIQQTSDGGYILLGESWSSESGDVAGVNDGNGDCWVVKLDPEQPDLKAFSFTAPTGTLDSRTFTVSYAPINVGTAPAGAFSVGFYLSADWDITTADTLIGTQAYTGLAPGLKSPAVSTTLTLSSSIHGGSCRIGAIIDPEGTVTESDETNNVEAPTGAIGIPGLPDMGIANFSPPVGDVEHTFTIQNAVVNLGDAPTGPFTVDFHLITFAGGGGWIGSRTGGPLAAGATEATQTTTVTVPGSLPSGQYRVRMVIDQAGTVTEYDEANNQRIHAGAVNIDNPRPILALPSAINAPTDTDGDRLYDDVNGNGRRDFQDIVLYFNELEWIVDNEPVAAFDCNKNGRIDFADVVWLFQHL